MGHHGQWWDDWSCSQREWQEWNNSQEWTKRTQPTLGRTGCLDGEVTSDTTQDGPQICIVNLAHVVSVCRNNFYSVRGTRLLMCHGHMTFVVPGTCDFWLPGAHNYLWCQGHKCDPWNHHCSACIQTGQVTLLFLPADPTLDQSWGITMINHCVTMVNVHFICKI